MISTLILGILFCWTAIAVMIREVRFRPENVDYPRAPSWLRTVMFIYGVCFLIIGSSALFSLGSGDPWHTEGPLVFASISTAAYNTAMLVNIRTQKFGPRVHSRIEQIVGMAKCRPDQQRARATNTETLHQAGATVAMPDGDHIQLPPQV